MSQVQEIFSSIECSFEQWTSSFAKLVVDSRHPVSVLKFANCLKSMSPEVALSLAKIVFLSDYRDILENVVTPCNIIQTTSDIVVPISVVNYMQAKIKGECKVDIMETDGHFPQLTAHLQFVETIHRILDN